MRLSKGKKFIKWVLSTISIAAVVGVFYTNCAPVGTSGDTAGGSATNQSQSAALDESSGSSPVGAGGLGPASNSDSTISNPSPATSTGSSMPSQPTAPNPSGNSASAESRWLEAEDAIVSGGALVETENAGYQGAGYVNFPKDGGALKFEALKVSTSGDYVLSVRFAYDGNTGMRSGELIANGMSQTISFDSTGSFTTYQIKKFAIKLQAGDANSILFQSKGQDLANIDSIMIEPGVYEAPVDPTPVPPVVTGSLPDYSKLFYLSSPAISFTKAGQSQMTDFLFVGRANPEMLLSGGYDPPNISCSRLTDPSHILKSDGKSRFARIPDPILGGNHQTFEMRVMPGDQIKWQYEGSDPSTRLEIAAASNFLIPGHEYAIAFAYTAPSVDPDPSTSYMILLQLHLEQGGNPPIRIFADAGGQMILSRTSSPGTALGGSFETIAKWTMNKNRYDGFLMKLRMGATTSSNPYLKFYIAEGLSSWKQVVNETRPNTFTAYPSSPARPRYGVYARSGRSDHSLVNPSNSSSGMVIYHKGMIIVDLGNYPQVTDEMLLNHLKGL